MRLPTQSGNPQVKPHWQLPVGVMESVVAYNCRKHGFPRPLLAMPMWEGAGNQVMDLSGNNNHGDFFEQSSWVGNGISLSGTDSGIFLDSDKFDVNEKTLVFSVASLASNLDQRLFQTSSTYTYPFSINNNYRNEFNVISIDNGRTNEPISSDDIVFDTPNNIAVTYPGNKSGIKVYKDGIDQTTYTGNLGIWFNSSPGAGIGCRSDGSASFEGNFEYFYFFEGVLDERQIKFISDNPYFMFDIPEVHSWFTVADVTQVLPEHTTNPLVKSKWNYPVGVMESVVAANCRKRGFPRPVLAMPMWEGAGNKLYDLSGHRNNGTFDGTGGWDGDGYEFAGDGGCNCGKVVETTGDLTFFVVAQPGTVTGSMGVIMSHGNNVVFRMQQLAEVYFITYNGGSYDIAYGAISNDPTRHVSFGCVHDGATNKLYYEGDLLKSTACSPRTSATHYDFGVARDYQYNRGEYEENMKVAFVWDAALTAEQMRVLHDNPYFMFEVEERVLGYIPGVSKQELPKQTLNPLIKPKWELPLGVMEGIVAYNCRINGFPRPSLAMPMWEGAGARVYDYSGHGNHGDMVSTNWTSTKTINFNDSASRINLTENITFGGDATFWCNYKLIADTYYGGVIGDSTASDAIELNNHSEIRIYESGGHSDFNAWPSNLDQWYTLMIARSGATWDAWRDGEKDPDDNYPITAGDLTFSAIGEGHSGASFIGEMDMVLVFPEQLTEDQAIRLHNDPYFMFRVPEIYCADIDAPEAPSGVWPMIRVLFGPLRGPLGGFI